MSLSETYYADAAIAYYEQQQEELNRIRHDELEYYMRVFEESLREAQCKEDEAPVVMWDDEPVLELQLMMEKMTV